MNSNKLEDSVSISTESQHRLIGLKYFKWHFSLEEPSLKIYYKDILLENHVGERAIELYKQLNDYHRIPDNLMESEIKRISENICIVSDAGAKTRNQFVVFSRYLFFHYFKRFTEYSLQTIGNNFNKDHASVIHGITVVNNKHLNGWKLDCRSRFENEINRIHEQIGIEKRFR